MSAASYITLGCTVVEVIARIMIGVADGLDFAERRPRLQVAGQVGERGVDRRLHVARGAVDVAVEVELHGDAGEPSDERDVISVTPGISPSRRSSGAATVCAMVSGSAPGRLALTLMVGKSTDGMLATGRKW